MVTTYLRALRELGLPSLSRYAFYRLALRSGYYRRRFPIQSWSDMDLAARLKTGVPSDAAGYAHYRSQFQRSSLVQLPPKNHPDILSARQAIERRAADVLSGRFRLFGAQEAELGFPPDWQTYAPLGELARAIRAHSTDHWSKYDEVALPHDVKLLWEASRFAWVYPLAQAFHLTGDTRYYDGFWVLYKSWLEANPPQAGLHWSSAQEVAIRLIALIFAAEIFHEQLNGEPVHWIDLMKGISAHARRIPPTLAYARAQNNNHLLVESLALFMTGVHFPELREAHQWTRRGRAAFEHGILGQVFADGGYVQHSTNYQRMALQAGLLAALTAGHSGEPLSEKVLAALRRMADLLAALTEEQSGITPNYGPNDGAMLLPFSTCEFDDYRPTLQAAWRLLLGNDRYPAGRWDDFSCWLGLDGGRAADGPPGNSVVTFPQAGLHIVQQGSTRVILRAADFVQRPGHSDQLHLDIWHGAKNLARDPGTYHYNAPAPWQNPFSSARAHNTVMIKDREPMLKAGRFLWLDWSRAILVGRWTSPDRQIEVLWAQHQPRRWGGISHMRTVATIGGELIIVADDVLGAGDPTLVMNWNLADLPWEAGHSTLALHQGTFSASISWDVEQSAWGLYRAGLRIYGEDVVDHPVTHGWHAPTYALKEPALQVVLSARGELPVRMVTTWALMGAEPAEVGVEWQAVGTQGPAMRQLAWGNSEWVV